MLQAFRNRRPWSAALISLVLSAFIGMLYLNRIAWALVYLVVHLAGATALWLRASHLGLSTQADHVAPFTVAVLVVGAVHAFLLARKRSPDERLHWYARWYGILAIIVLIFAFEICDRAFFYQAFNIPGISMSPTLNIGDKFFAEKFAYNVSAPQRGDLIVFHARRRAFVKRVVGLPGDRVQMKHGKLYLNGNVIAQHRMPDFTVRCGDQPCLARQYEEILPGGRRYRILDIVPNGVEDNTPIFVVPARNYFVVGDNRDNSDDSRVGLGYVRRDAILGRATLKYIDGLRDAHTWQPIE